MSQETSAQSALRRCAVIGNPIAHSRSPEIHAQFAKNTGISLQYDRILAHDEDFIDTVKRFFSTGGVGLNVTVPFKVRAFEMCEVLSSYAQAAGAVNTLSVHEGKLYGDNTDGRGLVKALGSHGAKLDGAEVLLLGAGGAARGAMLPLLEAGAKLSLYNRTPEKALSLAHTYAQRPNAPKALCLDELREKRFDIIINATSAGLSDDAFDLPIIFDANTIAYDMVYGKETPFLQYAKRFGAKAFDGYSMLLEQARLSFEIWFGVLP